MKQETFPLCPEAQRFVTGERYQEMRDWEKSAAGVKSVMEHAIRKTGQDRVKEMGQTEIKAYAGPH